MGSFFFEKERFLLISAKPKFIFSLTKKACSGLSMVYINKRNIMPLSIRRNISTCCSLIPFIKALCLSPRVYRRASLFYLSPPPLLYGVCRGPKKNRTYGPRSICLSTWSLFKVKKTKKKKTRKTRRKKRLRYLLPTYLTYQVSHPSIHA